MFRIDTKDKTIHVTRGDAVNFDFVATREDIPYIFEAGDVVRLNITQKKNCAKIVLSKDFHVQADAEKVEIVLDENETKFGEVINAPADYWYEFVLNPFDNPRTILGYDEDGAKIFKLYPEGKDYDNVPQSEIPVVDSDFSLESDRPVANYVVTGKFIKIEADVEEIAKKITGESIVPIERAAFEEMLSMGTWAPNTFYAILEESEEHIQSNTGFYNGKYTGFSYIHKDGNVYTKTQNGTGTLRLSDVKEGQEIHVYITSGALPMKGVTFTASNSSEVNTYTTDENGRATVLALVDFTEISTKPYSYNIKAEYEKSVDDEFKNAYSEIHLVGADALAALGKIDEVQIKLENQNNSFAGAYRTTLTKEYDEIGMEIDLYDIDSTEHTIEVNLNIDGSEIVAGVINPDGELGEHDSYFVENGIVLVPALSTAMFFRCYAPAPYYPLFYSITYNKSISSAFEEVKNQAQTAISGVKMLDEKITNQISKNAGALKGTKSGVGSVVIDDIDHTEHDINIFVSQEEVNLCPYDFIGTNELFGGEATLTHTEDGRIEINGFLRYFELHILRSEMYLEAGTYTIGTDDNALYFNVESYNEETEETEYLVERDRRATFTLDTAKTVSISYGLEIAFGDSVNINTKPRLYKGTEYGFDAEKVRVTVGNASYTPDADGHVSVKAIYPELAVSVVPNSLNIKVDYNKALSSLATGGVSDEDLDIIIAQQEAIIAIQNKLIGGDAV